jgi:hypothetical protein
LRSRLEYGSESMVVADIENDLDEVLRITQNLSGIPPYKLKFFKEFFMPLYKTKESSDEKIVDGVEKEERIPALTTRELCNYYKDKTGKTTTANNLKQSYLNEFLNNGLIEEEDSVIDKRQKIYYPLINLPQDMAGDDTNNNGNGNEESQAIEKINKLSISNKVDNFSQRPHLLLSKNFIKKPENWLKLEILELLKYPSKLNKFELYNDKNERICICKFVKHHQKSSRFNGYFSRPVFCNYDSVIFSILEILIVKYMRNYPLSPKMII